MAADLHVALMERVRLVREFRETESIKHVVRMLDAARDSLIAELVDVTPERLTFTQGALKQVMALSEAITGTDGYVPIAQTNL
jgi:hypothetical protein